MIQAQYSSLLLDQTKDLIWVVNQRLYLVYANKAFVNVTKEVTGEEKKLNEYIFEDKFVYGNKENWTTYYKRGLNGEHFEIEDQFYNPISNQVEYSQISFKPITDENDVVVNVACQSRDITSFIKSNCAAKKLLDTTLDVFCTIDKEGFLVHVSAASFSLWGYLPDELQGKAYQDYVLEEDKAKTEEAVKAIMSGQDTRSFTNRCTKKDGSIAYNHWSATWDENSNLIYAVARDANEAIAQEEKLVRSEQRFKALVQGGYDLYAIVDLQGRYMYMSPSSTAIIGIPPEAFIGRDAFEFIHPDDMEQTLSSLKKVTTEGKVVMKPYRAKNQHDEWRWVETVLTNMLDNPAVNGIVINARDITKDVEEKRQLKLLESVITNTKDAVLITEAEPFDEPGNRIIYVNEAFTKMTGYTSEEVIGKTPRILQGPKTDKEALAKLGQSIRKWEPYEITTINYKKSGEEFWINFSLTPVADETGWYTHWIAIERDVTEQKNKALEKELINTISDIFHESNDTNLTTCLLNLCKQIVTFGDFDLAEIWLPSIDDKKLNQVANYSKGEEGNVFYQATKQITSCAFGEGLPGHVWKNKKTAVWEHVEGKWLSERKLAAQKAGFKAMMGVPLLHKGEVIGVLSLGTVKTKSALTQYISILKKLESAIGSELSRKKIEIELLQIFDFTPDLICVAGFDGYIKRINPAGLAILGYSLDEIRSRPIISFIHPQDHFLTKESRSRLYRGENLENFENRYITKEGKVVWLSWTSASLPEQGVVYAVAKNITEEKNLRELNRQVGKLAKIGSWEVDVVNNTVFWSEEVHQIYGTDPKSFVPTVDIGISLYREDYRDLALSSFEKCILTQEPYAIEAVIVDVNNKEVWVQTTAKAEFVDGVCTRVYGSFQDIDDRKQSEIRLQSFSENLPGVVYQYIIHPDGTDSMQFIYGMVEKLWGYTTNEVLQNIDLLWDQIKQGGDIEEVKSSIAKSIETKSKWACRFKIINHTGEIRTHFGSGTPIFLADGTILFHVMVLDITQEAKNEELLEEVTNMARIGSWELDLINQDGDSIYWSPILREIVEVDESYNPTLTGGIEFHVGESKERIQKAIDLLINEGTEFDEEVLLRTAKGNERWNRCIGKREMANGKLIRIYGSYQDIHERKTSELELLTAIKKAEESDARFKSYTEQSPIGIYTTDINGDCIYANETWLEMAGMQLEEALGKGWMNALHPEDLEYVTDNWYKLIESHGEWNYEYRFVNSNKDIIWVNGNAKKLFNNKNELIGFLGANVNITDRKKVENKLIESENYLRTILDNEPECVKVLNSKGELLSMNPAGLVMIEADNEQQVLGHRMKDLVNKEYQFGFNKLTKEVFKGNSGTFEFEITGLKGGRRWLETHAVPLKNTNGKIVNLLGVTRDITERKKAEEKLLIAFEEKNNILESIGDAFFAVDKNWIVTYWNKEAVLILGIKREDIVGKNLWEVYHDAVDLESYKQYHKAIETGDNVSFEDYYPTIEKWFEVSAYPSKEGLSVYFKDITQRKEADNRLKEANERFEKVTEATNDAIYDWNLKDNTIYWGGGFKTLFGHDLEKIPPSLQFWSELIHPDDLERVNKSLNKVIESDNSSWLEEYRFKRGDGSFAFVVDRGIFIKNSKGESLQMIGSMTDISERKHHEVELLAINQKLDIQAKELERSNKELEQFAFIASHDLQEPLRMISSFMDLLKRKYGDSLDEKGLQYIHFATDGAKRMKQIILDLLLYSRANRPNEQNEWINLNEIVSEYTQLRRKVIVEKSATISYQGLPTIETYRAPITQVFHCLLDNALKYMDENKTPCIEIDVIEKENVWQFAIKDNGIGIDPKYFDKIFAIFQRLQNRKEHDGTGIGLAIAKRSIEFLGGEIWVESEIGKGATFYFTINKNKQHL